MSHMKLPIFHHFQLTKKQFHIVQPKSWTHCHPQQNWDSVGKKGECRYWAGNRQCLPLAPTLHEVKCESCSPWWQLLHRLWEKGLKVTQLRDAELGWKARLSVSESICIPSYSQGQKQKWKKAINNTKLKKIKRFDHDRVCVAQHCLNQPQMQGSFIRGISHNWDETRLHINGGKIHWLILLEFNSISSPASFPWGKCLPGLILNN